jgi:hypothetical protein
MDFSLITFLPKCEMLHVPHGKPRDAPESSFYTYRPVRPGSADRRLLDRCLLGLVYIPEDRGSMFLPKDRRTSTGLHGGIYQKTVIVVLTSNPTLSSESCISINHYLSFKSSVTCDITPCSPLRVNRRFGKTDRLQLQGQ